jgi:uncharacterized phage-associated protein
MIRFNFDESKTLEALVYIARAWDGISPFYLSKVLFFADRNHLRAYGRPVTGDSYIAMVDGPVPSRAYDIVKGNLDFFGDPQAIEAALTIDRDARYHRISAKRDPNIDLLSETDVAALDEAIGFCRGWANAPTNSEMNLELLVPKDMREEIRETAAYAIL